MSDRTLVQADGRSLRVRICGQCGYAIRNDGREIAENLDKQVEYFDAAVKRPDGVPRWPDRDVLLADEVSRLAPRAGRMLDIGCGPGRWLRIMGQRGWELHGLEVAPAVAQVAREYTGARVECVPLEQFDSPVAAFDLITAFALIEHLIDPALLVQWAHRHLVPDGLFVVMTGDRDSVHGRQAGDQWSYYWIDEHVSFFSGKSLKQLIADGGFDVVRQEWRYSCFERPPEPVTRIIAKAREITRRIEAPRYDLVYVYARKRA